MCPWGWDLNFKKTKTKKSSHSKGNCNWFSVLENNLYSKHLKKLPLPQIRKVGSWILKVPSITEGHLGKNNCTFKHLVTLELRPVFIHMHVPPSCSSPSHSQVKKELTGLMWILPIAQCCWWSWYWSGLCAVTHYLLRISGILLATQNPQPLLNL